MAEATNLLRFLPQPQIVAVDNNKDQLDLIVKGLLGIGLPVIPIHYDITTGCSAPQLREKNQLRIIFLDLNLNDIENTSTSHTSSLAAPIVEVLKELSPAGPYFIVFWTKHPGNVEEVMKHIAKDRSNDSIHLPIKYTVIKKDPFLPVSGEHNQTELENEISRALTEEKIFLSLLSWESGVKDAAARTLNKIVTLVTKRQADGTSLKVGDLKHILQSFGNAAWGNTRAPENPGRAVTHGLSPLLIDHLDSIAEDQDYQTIWSEALSSDWKKKLIAGVSPSALNSHCLIDLSNHDKNLRGNWFEFSEKALRKRTIWKKMFDTDLPSLLEEFINPQSNESNSKKIVEVRNSVKLGLLECTAACDFANNKAPLQRYILCAKIPVKNEDYIKWDGLRRCKHQAIHKIEKVIIDDIEYMLYLDFKYVLSLPLNHEFLTQEFSEAKFRVRNQVLIDIISKYANHTTRPGIFSFQSK